MSGGDRRRQAEAGFTLLETLVAAAIIAATLGMTYDVLWSGARAARDMQDRRTAALIAQSLLAQVGATIPLSPGASSGREGMLTWLVDIDADRADRAGDGPPPLSVRVTVGRIGETKPLLAVRTLKLGA